jgi:hypothetical protein
MFGVNGTSSKLILNLDDYYYTEQVLVRTAYDTLGLQTYFTSGPTETRAWTIRKGSTAPQVCFCGVLTVRWQTLDEWIPVTMRRVVMCCSFCCSVLA